MKPTLGRTVIFRTTESQRNIMSQLHCNEQEYLPATIVAVWGDSEDACVNLKVHLDGGSSDLWVTSVNRGDEEYNWNWPTISK